MKKEELHNLFASGEGVEKLVSHLKDGGGKHLKVQGLIGSARAVVCSAVLGPVGGTHIYILNDKETAAYFFNDMESLFGEMGAVFARKKVLFFPSSYKRPFEPHVQDKSNTLARSEVFNRLAGAARKKIVVTYPEALCEKIITRRFLSKNTIHLNVGEEISLDFIIDVLNGYGFERQDFVVQPGQFSVRGGIVDVFSYSNDYPFRIEFFGDDVESIRTFDPASQLSREKFNRIRILPDIHSQNIRDKEDSLLSFISGGSVVWIEDIQLMLDKIAEAYEKAYASFVQAGPEEEALHAPGNFISGDRIMQDMRNHRLVEFGKQFTRSGAAVIRFKQSPQPSFNKNFQLLIQDLNKNSKNAIKNVILSDNPKQLERLYAIFEDVQLKTAMQVNFDFDTMNISLHEGFIDKELKLACYTDHQIFERYHRFYLKDSFTRKEAITLKELNDLQPGDYVTHIDHGVGRFDGLEKIDNNGKEQEAIRLIYKNSDILYVSIHSLHRIAKYVGREGSIPRLDRLGSNAWNRLKNKTKKKVKDIAKELIALYARRKASEGFGFSPDTYMQNELEASFIYEDTPDQIKATQDVKSDMEKPYPMDRLICGDVGFGKTEVAIRAAFKSVSDSKQVAVLVPTTILALQHYHTFRERLKTFPCTVDFINRFKSAKKQKETLKSVSEGTIDIIIGTHRLISKDVKFRDLGLLILDEEQKFGVSAKERLKEFKVNVDTLTLTATPIPRTLQFSLMGARDLSIINTPPPNRYPVQTEISSFNEEVIREAIYYEIARGGQIFFLHNRVQNIGEVEQVLHRFCPDIKIAVAHGQLEGRHLEKVMMDFINQQYDLLLATTIIESGLDIPNVNTIIINDAHNFGLSDLHQLRGRVGRTNKKAFCYLLAPPLSIVTPEARKRLKAVEEFSDLGSGFNIAMRDLDIRGAGNILGAEQSGFISEIGFEMYHKILNEAINELKETEFKGFFKDEEKRKAFVSECQIETDMELMIPDHYITNITERLSLYRGLDNMTSEAELDQFRMELSDRFGPVPEQVEGLMDAIRLRWLARKGGFEKIFLKKNRMIVHFVRDQDSEYYRSGIFTSILKYVQNHPKKCLMKEKPGHLTMTVVSISTVREAIEEIKKMLGPDQSPTFFMSST